MVGQHGGTTWWDNMVGQHGGATWWGNMEGQHHLSCSNNHYVISDVADVRGNGHSFCPLLDDQLFN